MKSFQSSFLLVTLCLVSTSVGSSYAKQLQRRDADKNVTENPVVETDYVLEQENSELEKIPIINKLSWKNNQELETTEDPKEAILEETVVNEENPNRAESPYETDLQNPLRPERRQLSERRQEIDNRFHQGPSSCQAGQYMCRKVSPLQQHVRCIPNEWKCNGVRECEENDDEENCSPQGNQVPVLTCNSQQYTCKGTGINGTPAQCINLDKICDETYDCRYGDDEKNCVKEPERQPDPYQQQQPNQHQNNYNPEVQPPNPGQNQYKQTIQCPTSSRNEEYIKRLEWLDRCYRSCMRYHSNRD